MEGDEEKEAREACGAGDGNREAVLAPTVTTKLE